MGDKPKFYRTVYSIEVLSEEAPNDMMSLEDITYDITEGHCSGVVHQESIETVTGAEMARLLRTQFSDPEFFQLDADGNDLEES